MTTIDGIEPRRATLFVDFDNIYIGLRALDPTAAEAFASNPARWVTWLEGANGQGSPAPGTSRRFLVKNVYLNPVTFGAYRAVFTRSGFRAIDCPPLTSQGKNSADIYMVLDILDALAGPIHYEDFVIMSADADFTPILQRLRAHDRRTTVVTAGFSAAAYRATTDAWVAPEHLAAAALGQAVETDETADTALVLPPSAEARRTAAARAPQESLREVVDGIRRAVAETAAPLTSAAAAQAALEVDPGVKAADWYGAGSFRAFVALYLNDLAYVASPPGFVFDPTRHSANDVPTPTRSELSPLLQQVCTVTGAPALPGPSYRTLFEALAADAAEHPYHLTETSKRVRDATAIAGHPVNRNAVAFVMKGLVYSGTTLTSTVTAGDLAEAWFANLLTLCANAQMPLEDAGRAEIRAWVTGAPT